MDFALILVIATGVTGTIWALDTWLLKPQRVAQAHARSDPDGVREPILVEYARSFFPVILIVLLVRSFFYEPFRIPSSSMMPTLLVGDFIFVNKFVYGLRLPVLNTRIVDIGSPRRGDVVVFKLPSDPSTNYIKRLIGLPGDRIVYRNKRLSVNDEPVGLAPIGIYEDFGHAGAEHVREQLGEVVHDILLLPHRHGKEGVFVVPEGHYFFMGDNRDNSQDSRYRAVGPVPEDQIVGKAVRVWMNWAPSVGPPMLDRIGDRIN